MRASLGLKTVLELGSVKETTRKDYEKKLNLFYRSQREGKRPRRGAVRLRRLPVPEWRRLELRPEVAGGPEVLEAGGGPKGSLRLPRFKRSLKGWRRLAPVQTRLPMIEFVKGAISGLLFWAGKKDMALCNETTFYTYLCRRSPSPQGGGFHWEEPQSSYRHPGFGPFRAGRVKQGGDLRRGQHLGRRFLAPAFGGPRPGATTGKMGRRPTCGPSVPRSS